MKPSHFDRRDVEDFVIGSVWAYSTNPAKLWPWPDRAPDAVFVITDIPELTPVSLVFCLIVDDLNERSSYVGKLYSFELGSSMAINSRRIA